jgi:F-type H+-transporting ATPase subunit delta
MSDDFTFSMASAIFKSSKKDGLEGLLNFLNELNKINNIFNDNKELLVFFNHPVIDHNEKIKLVKKLTDNKLLLRFLKILIRFKRINSLSNIVYYLSTLVKIETKSIDAELKLPYQIDEDTKQKLKSAIEKYTGKNINLNVFIDENIIGGIYLKIGNTVIDYTLNRQLQQFKERLI